MSLIEILPGVVKELVKHVPALAFEVTDWVSVKRDLPVLTGRLFWGTGVRELSDAQKAHLGQFITYSNRTVSKSGPQDLKSKGDALLRFYFAQLHSPDGVFLDLRDSHFQWDSKKLIFQPNGFWYRFSEDFRRGILTLYEGFYTAQESKFEAGLVATHLLDRSWPIEDQEEIKNLFRSHFGNSLERPMRFDMSHFQETFLKIFEFLLKKKVKLSSEFMLFGLYLVTLYLSLEKYGSEHEVKRLYLEVVHGLE